jgi:hypothetical protein
VLGQPPPQRDLRQAEQASRERSARLESAAARRAQLGLQKPKMRDSVRHWLPGSRGARPRAASRRYGPAHLTGV